MRLLLMKQKPNSRVSYLSTGKKVYRCSTCGERKDVDAYYAQRGKPIPVQPNCKVCEQKRRAARRTLLGPAHDGVCAVCGRRVTTYHTRQVRLCRGCQAKKENARWLRWKSDLRREFIAAYGGQCACCGETEPLFLTLEHLNGDGREHRLRVGRNTTGLLADLKHRGWPKDKYQLLCMNCNWAKGHCGGVCPHKRKAQASDLLLFTIRTKSA